MLTHIYVKGARAHNLKNIDVSLPRDKLVVVTGLSGSGKSSLAFDTIYAEGQRRYVESLSSYARMFLGQMEKPDVDYIDGLSPAISIDQKTTSKNPRSTVGTVTEIYDYLRLLWARVGTPHCPKCGKEIRQQSIDQIIDQILSLPEGTRIQVLAPVIRGKKGEHTKVLENARKSGYVRCRVDGVLYELTEDIPVEKNKKHNIEIVVDRLVIRPDILRRLTDSVETAASLGGGLVLINLVKEDQDLSFSQNYACEDCGISIEELSPRMFSFNSPFGACPTCTGLGSQMKADPQLVIPNPALSILDGAIAVSGWQNVKGDSIARRYFEALDFVDHLTLTETQAQIAQQILKEIKARLTFLQRVGLAYLTLSRQAGTLSGGESQRIRLATQIGSSLMGVLYILDEPSIGLHQRDNDMLLDTLKHLRDLGNTLIVVEHDEDTMRAADYIVDIGPAAGVHGGQVVAAGTAEEIMACPDSITGQYLSGAKQIPVPPRRRPGNGHSLTIRGAQENNLDHVDVSFPLGTFTCVTGVSGSGKSSLVNEILFKRLGADLNRMKVRPGKHEGIEGEEFLDKVIAIDQSPIGRTPRSNPATYTGLFGDIRELFASTPDAKSRGYGPGRFSFNVKGGRCESCAGDGLLKIEMHFLPDIYVPCEVCKGKRYNRETLEVKYKGKNIHDVLNMTVDEGLEFFANLPKLRRKLETLSSVGLGYLKIGQSSTTLSGGEAQRVKLATELSRRSTGKTIYILDEPTTGLHTYDVHKLLEVLDRLVEGGNTVVVIEHNLDVIKWADHVIDLGPEGGSGGGHIVCTGTPEEVAQCAASYTGQYLKRMLEK